MSILDTHLDAYEARVLGCLIEKEQSTPEYYPLTLNALTAACNQKSNRDPVMALDSADVIRALDGLRDRKLAWEATSASTRVPKYKHRIDETLNLSKTQSAILCELLVRGPQTIGGLRTHSSRLLDIGPLDDVSALVTSLAEMEPGPLVVLLPREPGKREPRYAHLLCGTPDLDTPEPPPEPARVAVREADTRLQQLEERVEQMETAFEQLQQRLDSFMRQFE